VRKVLIVDDEHGILVILDAVLSDAGYRTFLAANGKQAIELFKAENPDIVLMDWMMPLMDGPTAARAMYELRPDIPIVFMSGADRNLLLAQVPQAKHFIEKPFRASGVLAALTEALSARR
jgi:CheY-like chemotaxis protein